MRSKSTIAIAVVGILAAVVSGGCRRRDGLKRAGETAEARSMPGRGRSAEADVPDPALFEFADARDKDAGRVADLKQIQAALEEYLLDEGRLPKPAEYGEGNVSPDFWSDWWDLSTADANGDGNYFLDFLVDSGFLSSVPVDPDNEPLNDNNGPYDGKRYVYFVSPAGYSFEGGTCVEDQNKSVYMLAITDLESEVTRPPMNFPESGCECLWLDKPSFFEATFDYVLCGTGPSAETYVRNKDARRVADLQQIQAALEAYLLDEGRLPRPAEYGEGNVSPGFWSEWWDLSTADADGDGNYFLDFLVDSRFLSTVPVDPDNEPLNDNNGPQGGRRYAYFVSPAGYHYEGGTCVTNQNKSVYMLAITDLESEVTRPSMNFPESGCDCLWLDKPNFFEAAFDYVLCGTF